jgi:uncharacterized RDD family membrane protein YckC
MLPATAMNDSAPIPSLPMSMNPGSTRSMASRSHNFIASIRDAALVTAQESADHNGCDSEPTEVRVSDEVLHYSRENCDATTDFYVVEEGGHTWPGGVDVPGSAKTPSHLGQRDHLDRLLRLAVASPTPKNRTKRSSVSNPPPPPPPAASPPPGASSWDADERGHAGFGSRLGAIVLDAVLYGLAAAVPVGIGVVMIVAAFSDCTSVTRGDTTDIECPDGEPSLALLSGGISVILAGLALVALIYFLGLARRGQTWGKRIVGVTVIRKDNGDVPGLGRAVGRELFAMVISSSIFYLGFLWMLWDRDRQTWHDKVAGTIVVSADSRLDGPRAAEFGNS